MSFVGNHLPSQRYSPTDKPWLACWREDLKSDVKIGIHREFSSTIFRMAMKAHRQCHDTAKLLGLLSYQTENIIQRGFVEQRAAAVRIHDGSLLVREQRVFMVPCTQKIPLPWTGGIDICPHNMFATMLSLHKFGIHIPFAEDLTEKYANRQGIIYCEYCYTEFRVDFKSFGKEGNAMFVTRWMDIGEGRDLLDRKWRSRHGKRWTKVEFRRGSICAAFEEMADTEFKFDELLTKQNEKDLCTKTPWPWPENIEVSYDNVRRYFAVRNGRFVYLSRQRAELGSSSQPDP